MNNNEIYVNNQPERSIFSVIIMDTEFPISKKLHESITNLQKFSDTCYLFSDDLYSSKRVSKKKFTSLYEGNCWINVEGDNILPSIMKVFDYALEIFNKHSSFMIMNLSDLEKYSEEEWVKFKDNCCKVNSSNILRPILKIDRIGNEDIYEYYRKDEECAETDTNPIIEFFPFNNAISRKLGLNYFTSMFETKESNDEEDCSNMYSSWITSSRVLFFRRPSIKDFITFIENNPDFIDTFDGDKINIFFPSIINRLRIKYHNSGIEDLDLGEKI